MPHPKLYVSSSNCLVSVFYMAREKNVLVCPEPNMHLCSAAALCHSDIDMTRSLVAIMFFNENTFISEFEDQIYIF